MGQMKEYRERRQRKEKRKRRGLREEIAKGVERGKDKTEKRNRMQVGSREKR